ncbi:MAG: T9SS type A sorting domain-containing protein [Chitinophagaceae bacterium]
MKHLYPTFNTSSFISSAILKAGIAIFFLVAAFSSANAQSAQELVFKNATLQSGVAGADGAVYRFPSVKAGTDALVKINGRSSSMVKLVTIDLTTTGFEKSFQPQVTYGSNNTSPAGNTDWWMEFQISFVQTATNTATNVTKFDVTGLDIDGNGDKISEYQSYYGLQTYTLESNTALAASNIKETVAGLLTTVGKRFDGPVKNYADVDTNATAAMATSTFLNTNSFRLRTGAKSTGVSGAADRMYSLWFKTFTYDAAVTTTLPVTIINWSAVFASNNIALKWTTTSEKNASHFIIERSFDGVDYSDVAMIFANGNSSIAINYAYNDKLPSGNNGVLYYRLKMVDMDGKYTTSAVKIVRVGSSNDAVKILAYPNPVVNDIRVTIPQNWQGKTIGYQVANVNGQIVKSYTVQYASQTEVIAMSQVPAGMYVIKVSNGSETAVQSVIKSNK